MTGPTATPWVFGEAPLPQTGRYATVVRDLTDLVLRLEHEEPRVEELIAVLEAARDDLAGLVPPDLRPRVGAGIEADGRVYLDHGGEIGAYNPAVPRYDLAVEGARATGTVRFPLLYEGPPGLVHGGFLACFVDTVVQHHNCLVGQAGKTTGLELRYSAPTPLLRDLRFEVTRRVEDRRIESTVELLDGDTRCITAVVRAVAGVRSDLPPVGPRRPR